MHTKEQDTTILLLKQSAQQIIAPDWLQLRSFLTSLPPAGEFSRCAACILVGIGLSFWFISIPGAIHP
jgi:hypothetical protein